MIRKTLLLSCLLLFGVITSLAQGSSCQCTRPGGCSASQTCPNGYIAVCDCEATICSSKCDKITSDLLDRPANVDIVEAVKTSAPDKLNEVLSRSMGKQIVFTPAVKGFKFDYTEAKSGAGSHWEILEYLAANGKVTISGIKIDSWRIMHDTLLNGGEHSICFSDAPVNMILNHISFISGKRYAIIEGDPGTKITGPLEGNGVNDLIEKLGKLARVTIVQN